MSHSIQNKRLTISGMTCVSCQNRIETALRNTPGIVDAKVSYSGGFADVTYDPHVVSIDKLCKVIERLDYRIHKNPQAGSTHVANEMTPFRFAGVVIIVAALYFLFSRLNFTGSFPLAEADMGFGMLFLIGLMTSVHCIAMCGGINLSQCIPKTGNNPLRSSAVYNLGRVISYTVVGFIVGGLGSVITLGGSFKGIVQIIAGVFMVIMGLNMLGIFPWLRNFMPQMPTWIAQRADAGKRRSHSPLIVGLLNGLMPCGPLQTMQIYAISTGSPIRGALSMLLFSLGTVPLMFGLGALSSILTKKFTHQMMTAGAVLVIVLGFTMFRQGAVLSDMPMNRLFSSPTVVAEDGRPENEIVAGVQYVSSTLTRGTYPNITVQQGVPVQWTIDAPTGSINGCNDAFYIPEYDLNHGFIQGENVIEFTPNTPGEFQYTCWMGMIGGTITVLGP